MSAGWVTPLARGASARGSTSAPAAASDSAPASANASAPAAASDSAPANASESAPANASESAPANANASAPAGANAATTAVHRPFNVARSVLHVGAAGAALAAVALLPSRGWLVAVPAGVFVYAWSTEAARRLSPRLNERVMRFYAPVAHPSEWHRVNSATWYTTALLALSLFATVPAMMTAVAVLGVADPVAGLVGRRWGRVALRANRSLEGSLAFFASGTLTAALVLSLAHAGTPGGIAAIAVLSGLTGAVAEVLALRLDDNFTIPLSVGAAATLATPLLSLL